MRRRIKFTNESPGIWFAEIPEWKGPKSDLQMVCGADSFLDMLCEGEWTVWITLSDEQFKSWSGNEGEELRLITEGKTDEGGAWYRLEKYRGISFDLDMWLCDVTKFVFGKFPEVIYFIV